MDSNQNPTYSPLNGSDEALRILELHNLLRALEHEGVGLGMLTRHAGGTVQVVLFTSLDLPTDEATTTFNGYNAAIEHLQNKLNEAWQTKEAPTTEAPADAAN